MALRRKNRLAGVECLESRILLAGLRIAAWNTLNNPNNTSEDALFSTVLQGIENEQVGGISRGVDLLALQETDSASISRLTNVLNSIGSGYVSARASSCPGGDCTGFIYNANTLQLVPGTTFQTLTGVYTHPPLKGNFRPVGTGGDEDFYAYSVHLKAGTSGSDETKRESEAIALRMDADAIGSGENVIVLGDFNLQGSSNEDAWPVFVGAGNAKLRDPINRLGNWSNNASFVDIHTQNPMDDPAGGYMDDRFDLQLLSDAFFDGMDLEYTSGSYRAFGNNGTHGLNNPINHPSNTSPVGSSVLNALALASDHLPVVVDYEFDSAVPGIEIDESGGDTSVAENGSNDSFSISLAAMPTSDVTVTVVPDEQIDLGNGAGVAVDRVFSSLNFANPQYVQVQANDDQLFEGSHSGLITFSTSSTDPAYASLTRPDLSVQVQDNEAISIEGEIETFAGTGDYFIDFNVTPTGGPINIKSFNLPLELTLPTGVTFSGSGADLIVDPGFEIPSVNSLSSPPFTSDYLISASAGNGAGLTISENEANALFTLKFTADSTAAIAGIVEIATATLSGLDLNLLQIITGDDDNVASLVSQVAGLRLSTPPPGITLVESEGDSNVVEGGSTDTFTIVLDTVPSQPVTVTLTPDIQLDLGAGVGIAIDRLFNPADALTPQSITVSAANDGLFEGAHLGQITTNTSSIDTDYDQIAAPGLTVAVSDNEVLTLQGESEPFFGEGDYWIDFYLTPTDGPINVKSFNVPMELTLPNGITFGATGADLQVDPGFQISSVNGLASPPFVGDYLISASAGTGSGLAIGAGERRALFSLRFTADSTASISSPTDIARAVATGLDLNLLQIINLADENLSSFAVVSEPQRLVPGDTTPPRVVDVLLSGSNWGSGIGGSPNFIDTIDGGGLGAGNGLGLSLPGADQLKNIPWNNVDKIHLVFDEDIGSFDASDFSLIGLAPDAIQFGPVGDYSSKITSVDYGPAPAGFQIGNYMATISLGVPFGATPGAFGTQGDRLTLTIPDGAVRDIANNALDGEWTTASSQISGDNLPGGEFRFLFDVLPGDVNNDNFVLADDVTAVAVAQGTFAPIGSILDSNYDPYRDVLSSNGIVLADDVSFAVERQGNFLFPPSGGSVTSSPLVRESPNPNRLREDLLGSSASNFDLAIAQIFDDISDIFEE